MSKIVTQPSSVDHCQCNICINDREVCMDILIRPTIATRAVHISGYTMMWVGRKSASTYGRRVFWKDEDDAFHMQTSGIGVQP